MMHFTRAGSQRGKIPKEIFAERHSESTDGLVSAIMDLTDLDQMRSAKLTNYLTY